MLIERTTCQDRYAAGKTEHPTPAMYVFAGVARYTVYWTPSSLPPITGYKLQVVFRLRFVACGLSFAARSSRDQRYALYLEVPMTHIPIPAEARIGHVHLRVADLERAIGFYRDLLGFDLLFNMGTAAFLSAG